MIGIFTCTGLLPTYEQIEAYATQALQTDLPEILAHFLASAKLDGTYFLCGQDDVLWAAELLNGVADLSLQVIAFCLLQSSIKCVGIFYLSDLAGCQS